MLFRGEAREAPDVKGTDFAKRREGVLSCHFHINESPVGWQWQTTGLSVQKLAPEEISPPDPGLSGRESVRRQYRPALWIPTRVRAALTPDFGSEKVRPRSSATAVSTVARRCGIPPVWLGGSAQSVPAPVEPCPRSTE